MRLESRTLRIILAAALCAAALSPGFAEAQLPPALDAALEQEPRDRPPDRLDFRMVIGGEGLTVRVDLTEEPPRYTLLEPDEEALSEDQRGLWNDFLDPESDAFRGENGLLAPLDLRAVVGETARLKREEGTLLVYSFDPAAMPGGGMDDGMDAMTEHLQGEIAIDGESGRPDWLRLFAAESFKPNFAIRVHAFDVRQTFVHEPALEGPRLARSDMVFEVSAAFRRARESLTMEFSNLVFDTADPQPAHLGEAAESP
ncbi:MAG: hypothetical protein ACLFQ5_11720 [Oceanicaulis sp.]